MPLQQPEGITAAEVDGALRTVLGRPEYAPPEPSTLHRWADAALRWFTTDVWPVIARWIPVPDASDPGWRILGGVLLVLGALVGAAVLLYWALRAFRWWRRRDGARGDEPGPSPGEPLTATDWDARAEAAAVHEEWRVAAHALYRATLLRLGEAGVVRVDGSKTPGDYRREVHPRDSTLGPDLHTFLGWFERVAYGRDEPGPRHYARLSDTARLLAPHG